MGLSARLAKRRLRHGLPHALNHELARIGSAVVVSWREPRAFWAKAERDARMVQVATAEDEQSFHVDLWKEGVDFLGGWTARLAETAQAVDAWLGGSEPTINELLERFPFLHGEDGARAYERGETIERRWQSLLAGGAPFERMQPLVDAAAADPTLRRLYPFTSMDSLSFSRWVGFPFSDDLPEAAPRDGEFYAWSATGEVLGHGSAARAVELIVASLPEPLEIVYRRPSA